MTRSAKILVAEDDHHILEGLVDTLESEGYAVTPASDGEQALRLWGSESFDLVILDIMMPGKSGYDVCRSIRSKDQGIPVIMLTAKGEEIDKVVGLELGADDYITKPFGVRELLARIAAVLRRAGRSWESKAARNKEPDHFTFGTAHVDATQYQVRVRDRVSSISAKELHLLRFLYANPSRVLTREELLNEVWGIDYYGTTRTLDQHIAQLRKKVEHEPHHPTVIATVHGVGYRYQPI